MLYLRQTNQRLALKLFRGEPAISGFDWNFSPIHTSSPPFFQRMCVRSSTASYGSFNLDMDRSPGFGSMISDSTVLLTLAFASAPDLKSLTLPLIITRRTVLQKVRRRTFVLRQLVNTGFQVLFHSPPGVLFTFPSQYYALSVTE